MLTGGAAFAETAGTGAASGAAGTEGSANTAVGGSVSMLFSDVAAGHWAEKHISKLSLQGIVKGNNGKFRPSDNVTQQEAVVMAIRFLGLENEVAAAVMSFPDSFRVGNYYTSYTALAFQKGLLEQEAEMKAAAADTSVDWGSKPATREWITKLVVRAIGEQEKAAALSTSVPAFHDAALADSSYNGYINAAVSLGLVNGVSANRFDPKGLVNRAMMATLLSRAEAKYPVNYEGQAQGVISAISDNQITLYYADGQTVTYAITPSTMIFRFDSEKASTLGSLNAYTNAMVITENGTARYIEQLDANVLVETVTGTIGSIDLASGELWLKVGSGYQSFKYDGNLVIANSSGAPLALTDLQEGSTVEVLRDKFRTTPLVVKIIVKGAPVSRAGSGTITQIQAGKITIQETESSVTWNVSSSVAVTRNGRPASLGEITAGDKAVFEIQNDLVTKLDVTATGSQKLTGSFNDISADGKTITYIVNGRPEAKFIAASAKIIIDGITNPGITDLAKDDELELTLNADGQVTQIKVINREVVMLNNATILSYVPESKVLTVADSSGKPHALSLSSKTRIDFNGTAMAVEAAGSMLVKGRKVSVGYSDSNAIILKFVFQYSGKLSGINSLTNQITIRMSDDSAVTLPLESPTVELLGKTNPVLADLKTGDSVTLLLNATQDKVVLIKVGQVVQQTVSSVDIAANKVKLTSAEGQTSEWSTGSAFTISDENGKAIALNQLAAGQVVNVTYEGRTAVAIKKVAVTAGQLVAVDAGKVTVKDYTGQTVVYQMDNGYQVMKNGASVTAGTLAVGDRVEIRKNTNDQLIITVNPGLVKTYWKYDAAAKTLYTTRSAVADRYMYTILPETVIQSADGAKLDIQNLKNGDKITLYLYQDKLLEVVKQ
ncbi:S-layer homology domain-containing protein [Paenibacillus tarimensis]|nr:S-layer homology domain-containing protein [Paenibacillus tarimensis]